MSPIRPSPLAHEISYLSDITLSETISVETDLGSVDFVELRTLRRDVSQRSKHSPSSDADSDVGSMIEAFQREREPDPINLGGLVLCSGMLASAALVGAFFFWTAPYFNRVYGVGMDTGG